VPAAPTRYRSPEEDSARWAGFPFRNGDIVISTRSKSGTTWMQMICALLIFQTPQLPGQLGDLSPWLDRLTRAGEMRRLAGRIDITVPGQAWPSLVRAATFDQMRARADQLIGPSSVLKSSTAFFRRGRSGAGREVLSAAELAHYRARAAQLAAPDLLRWLHRDD
jgi:hypothetical protein